MFRRAALLCAAPLALFPFAVHAQDEAAAPAASATDDAPRSGSPTLEDIVVTAQRREERLQDVPIAVTAVTGDTLTKSNVITTRDLQFVVPSLVYNQLSGYAQPFLRGIGSDLVGPNAEAGVATYVDGVIVGSGSAAILGLLGIDRIEVLAGPQGTLYGRNAVGGAINVYTLTPGDELKGSVTATYGNYDRWEGAANVSGPVSDTLSLGVYGAYTRRDSYYRRTNRTLPEPQHEINWGGRFKAVWTPSDDVKFTASVERLVTRSFEGGAYRNVQPDGLAYLFGVPNFSGDRYVIDSDVRQQNVPKQWGASLRSDIDFGPVQFVSLTSYRKLSADGSGDVDGTSAPILVSDSFPLTSKQVSQELQLLSPVGSAVSWIVGGYFYNETGGYPAQNTVSPIAFPPPIFRQTNEIDIGTRSFAIFGQATIPIDAVAEGMKLTLGGRYTIDRKKFRAVGQFFDVDDNQVGETIFYPRARKTWKEFTPKITLDYKTGDTLLYASYSKGFKAGAFNPSSPGSPGPVDPETLSAYEVGTKSTFGGRFRFNTSAYYYKFDDIQVSRVALGLTEIQNAASAEAYGVEASLVAAVTNDFTLTMSGALEHTEYTDFPNAVSYVLGPAGNATVAVDASGNDMIRAPKLVFNLGGEYNIPLANGDRVELSANWYHNGGYFWDTANQLKQPAYDLVNATIGYHFTDPDISVRAFVNNLTNQYYRVQNFATPLSVLAQDAAPRMYGVTASARF